MIAEINKSTTNGSVYAPTSKSMAHRLLICAALSKGESVVKGITFSQDILATLDCLKTMGASFEIKDDTVRINGLDSVLMKEEKELDKIFKEQLKRCKVEYFDYYFLHALNADVYKKAEELHAFDFLKKMKKEGKIKHIGFSFHDKPAVLKKILSEHKEVELVQLQVNYYDWTGTNVFAKQCLKIAQDFDKKIAIMEPLHGGDLAKLTPSAEEVLKKKNPDVSIASWGIRFAASQDKVMVVLSGMSNFEQLEDNMSYMKKFVPLDKKEISALNKAVKIIKNTIAIPCTGCRYCTEGCPKKISIPDYFRLFNQQYQFSLTGPIRWNYSETKKRGGKPADCIECGQCEKHCPQKIKIIEKLKEVRKTFEPVKK